MVQIVPILIAIVSLISGAQAAPYVKHNANDLAYLACTTYLEAVATFCGAPGYKCFCKNQPALASISSCYINYFDDSQTKIGYFLDLCQSEGNVTLTSDAFYAAYNNATDNNLFVDPDLPTFNATEVSYSPINVNLTMIDHYWNSISVRWYNYNRSMYYGAALLSYWAFVMVVSGLINWTLYFFPGIGHNLFMGRWRRYITLPAASKHHQFLNFPVLKFFKMVIPTRVESIILVGWFAMWIGFEGSNYRYVANDTIWHTTGGQMGRYVADRAGITGLFLIPLTILFSGRNNFMQFFTRWSYARMLTFHRWTSRILFMTVFMHGVTMSINGIGIGKYQMRNHQAYVRWGITAVVCAGTLMIQSLLHFRKHHYELFYLCHILLSVFFMVGAWRHNTYENYGEWMYAATALWCFDRFVRILRLIAFGAPLANVELRADETLKVTVRKPSYWKESPGQHAFVHFLLPTSFWQSHPFTLVDTSEQEHTISFYCKIKGGITSKLYQYINTKPEKTAQIRVSVEGPYGFQQPLKRFENVLFLAGGNGVPGLYYEARNLVAQDIPKQTLKFYWVIRHWKSLDWFKDELAKFENTKVQPIVYITQPENFEGVHFTTSDSSDADSNDKSSNEKSSSNLSEISDKIREMMPHVEFREGRPNIAELVKEALVTSQGSLAVVACAHHHMVDDTRKAVINEIGSTKNDIELFDEIQVW